MFAAELSGHSERSQAGSSSDELPIDEEVPLRPLSVYGASKAAADLTASQWGRAYGLDIVRARPFNHTGPGQSPTFVCPALAKQVADIEAGRQPPVLRVGNLDPVRDLSDVRDTVAGRRLTGATAPVVAGMPARAANPALVAPRGGSSSSGGRGRRR